MGEGLVCTGTVAKTISGCLQAFSQGQAPIVRLKLQKIVF